MITGPVGNNSLPPGRPSSFLINNKPIFAPHLSVVQNFNKQSHNIQQGRFCLSTSPSSPENINANYTQKCSVSTSNELENLELRFGMNSSILREKNVKVNETFSIMNENDVTNSSSSSEIDCE